MIDQLNSLAVFVAVVELGSFTAAGKHLKVSTSVVSHHISKLEDKFGVPLLFRSTRSLSLTYEGAAILNDARAMLSAGEKAMDQLAGFSSDQAAGKGLVGSLRVSLPAFGIENDLRRAFWNFAKLNPNVELSLHASDEPVDLVVGRFDIALRFGEIHDNTLICRRVGTFRRVIVCSPSYLAQLSQVVESPKQLEECSFISIRILRDSLTLTKGSQEVLIEPKNTRVEVNSISAAREALIEGLGVQRLPFTAVQSDLKTGRLVQLLPDWQLPETGVFAVWPSAGLRKSMTEKFVSELVSANNR